MRVAVAGFMHESNTFNPLRTDRAAFAAQSLLFGDDLLREWRDAHHEVGGFLESAQALGFEPVPLLMAWATPAGPVAADVFDEITGRLVDGLRRAKPDGLRMGPSVVVVTDNDPALGRRDADALADRLWEAREKLARPLPDAATAVGLALKADKLPVVLVDTGDNVGGGSAADGTILLA